MNALLAIAAIEAGGLNKVILSAINGGDLIKILMIIVFVVVPVIGKILSKLKALPPPKGAVRPARPAASGAVQNEIEDFLRRANQKRGSAGNRPQRPKPMRTASAEKPVRAEVVRDRPVGGEVERHVKKYLDEEEFVRRTEKLGEEVAEADDKIERHLKSVFDHSVSKLANTPGETASPPNAKLADTAPQISLATPSIAAADVAALFGNPLSIRQAVIISEILNRPLERWQREASFNTAAWQRRES